MSSLNLEGLESLLLLNRLGIRRKDILTFMLQGGEPAELCARILEEDLFGKKQRFEKIAFEFNSRKELEECHKLGIHVLTYFDEAYPSLMRETSDPPLLLYAQGHFVEDDAFSIAIVGSRHPNIYGMNQTSHFARTLSSYGLTVISGGAKGVDQLAHQAALEVPYGRTIGVMGCGLDVDYPKGSHKLKRKMIEHGLIISEYALGTPPLAENFPKRNRIIAGLALATFVVQAHERSGSLITAHQSIEEGRDVFALPGPVDNLVSKGTHRLIKEGAALVDSPDEIFEALTPMLRGFKNQTQLIEQNKVEESVSKTISRCSSRGNRIEEFSQPERLLFEILHDKPLTHNEILRESEMPPGELMALLLNLELKKKIKKGFAGRFEVV